MALLSANATLKRWEPRTVRTFLIRVAGKLLGGANQLRIKLPRQHLHPKVWEDWLALSQPLWTRVHQPDPSYQQPDCNRLTGRFGCRPAKTACLDPYGSKLGLVVTVSANCRVPQRHRVNRLPRQLRPEWVVTPCRRLLARFRYH